MLNGVDKTKPKLIEVFCGSHQFNSPSPESQDGEYVVTTGLLAYDPLVIALQDLGTVCGRERLILEEKQAWQRLQWGKHQQ